MPRVLGYTPAWLTRPSPGFQLFNTAPQIQESQSRGANINSVQVDFVGPNRTIARRDREIFVVAGKQIRWADLPSLKDQWQVLQETPSKLPRARGKESVDKPRREDSGPEDGSYRVRERILCLEHVANTDKQVLKPSIGEPIRQLCISPNEKLMTIVTSHTVHVAVLPISDLLNAEHNEQPLRLKTYTIGPTTHVLSQSAIASVLWHPLGEAGNCLVTITTDSVLRLWEFDTNNRWSADSPALAIDLKKLVIATSEDEDVQPNRSGRNKVFTSDAAGMEVASACFGGAGYGDESPWSAMTLWIAMKGGDIYALCPLLPSKWQPPSNLLPTLSSTIVEKGGSREGEGETRMFLMQQDENQFAWISDLDKQEPILKGESEFTSGIEVYKRPSKLVPVPRLQGPFQMFPENTDYDVELSDIHVIPAKSGDEESRDEDSNSDSDSEGGKEEGLSMSIVCLMTREGRVYVCLDVEGVEGQWLPRKASGRSLVPPSDPYLVAVEGLDTLKPGESCHSEWPMFSQDVESRYCFFTTHSRGVYYFSFQPWLQNLEKELQATESAGTPFRIDVFRNGPGTLRERILSFDHSSDSDLEPSVPACLTMQDSDLGYFLLTTSNFQAQAAFLDRPYLIPLPFESSLADPIPDTIAPARGPTRSAYQPSPYFYASTSLSKFLDTHVQARHKRIMKEEIRLSTATLDLMTEAHRILSKETHQIGSAAAQLFSRCQTLLDELQDQIIRAGEVARRTDQVMGEDPEGWLDGIEGKGKAGAVLEERIDRARERQGRLVERCEALRLNVKKVESSRPLSEREKAWKAEIEGMGVVVWGKKVEKGSRNVGPSEDGEVVENDEDGEVEKQTTRVEPSEDGEVAEEAIAKDEAKDEYDETHAEHLRRYREVCTPPLYLHRLYVLNSIK